MPIFKSWNGSSWVSHGGWLAPKVWNGSSWVVFNPKVWTGSGWGIVSVPQSRTVTVGSQYFAGDKFVPAGTSYGYSENSFGSINSNSLQLWQNGVIVLISWKDSTQELILNVSTTAPSNSAFTTMTIGSTSFSRASATYNTGSGIHYWYWPTITTNPFSAVGTNTTVSWT